MTRINVLLGSAALFSALFLVHTQYESRRLFVELEKAGAQARKLDVEHEALLAEKRAQATPQRIERLAKDKLQMRQATPAITHYVALRQADPAGQPAAKADKP
jgi:cell division protein FtsL